jgi:hypothetical protein
MATGPTIPIQIPNPTVLITNELSWFQKHERLIIVVLVLALGGWLGNKWMNVSAEHAKAALAVQQQASAIAATQADLAAKSYQAAIEALSKANVALAASQTARNTVLVKQQATTATQATVAPNDFVKTWQSLIPGTIPGNITQQVAILPDKTTSQQFIVGLGPAIETVTALEAVPVMKANLADEIALAGSTQTALNSCSTLVDKQVIEIAQDKKTCDAAMKDLKANARKHSRNWFIAGFVSGIATRLVLHW